MTLVRFLKLHATGYRWSESRDRIVPRGNVPSSEPFKLTYYTFWSIYSFNLKFDLTSKFDTIFLNADIDILCFWSVFVADFTCQRQCSSVIAVKTNAKEKVFIGRRVLVHIQENKYPSENNFLKIYYLLEFVTFVSLPSLHNSWNSQRSRCWNSET
jgi:hypothetical protein